MIKQVEYIGSISKADLALSIDPNKAIQLVVYASDLIDLYLDCYSKLSTRQAIAINNKINEAIQSLNQIIASRK